MGEGCIIRCPVAPRMANPSGFVHTLVCLSEESAVKKPRTLTFLPKGPPTLDATEVLRVPILIQRGHHFLNVSDGWWGGMGG